MEHFCLENNSRALHEDEVMLWQKRYPYWIPVRDPESGLVLVTDILIVESNTDGLHALAGGKWRS